MSAGKHRRPIRVGSWWRVWPDVAAHWLSDHRLLHRRLQDAACAWRGSHTYRYFLD